MDKQYIEVCHLPEGVKIGDGDKVVLAEKSREFQEHLARLGMRITGIEKIPPPMTREEKIEVIERVQSLIHDYSEDHNPNSIPSDIIKKLGHLKRDLVEGIPEPNSVDGVNISGTVNKTKFATEMKVYNALLSEIRDNPSITVRAIETGLKRQRDALLKHNN